MIEVGQSLREQWLADARAARVTQASNIFEETEYVVDATQDEQHGLWWLFHEHYRVPWKEITIGFMRELTRVRIEEATTRDTLAFKRHIATVAVEVYWARIGPAVFAFVHSPSSIAHYGLIEAWQRTVFPCMHKKQRHSDAANFGNLVNDMIKRHKLDRNSVFGRDAFDIERMEIDEVPRDLAANPQAAYEHADAKVQWWSARAAIWREKAGGPAAPYSVDMRCGRCHEGQQTRSDGFGGKWDEPCRQCRGRGKVTVALR